MHHSYQVAVSSRLAIAASDRRATLIRLNTADLLGGLGLTHPGIQRCVAGLVQGAAARFADQMLRYDDEVGAHGLAAGGAWALAAFGAQLRVRGAEHLPGTGPLLIAANHPGLTDTVALFAALARPDLRIVAADRPFLRALSHTAGRLIFVDQTNRGRVQAFRTAARHLRGGGAILTFPGGAIEPDPAVLPGAATAVEHWSDSLATFARVVPELQIVPAIVSGVLNPRAVYHPLTRLRRQQADQHWLGALLQIQVRSLQHTTVQIDIGSPLEINGLPGAAIMQQVRSSARQMISMLNGPDTPVQR